MISKKKIDINKIVSDCRRIADNHIKHWKPVDSEWPTINGAGYLRLSTDEQVLVEKGSLEQQVYLAISEAEIRSRQNRTNYRITNFYIEPGISGQKDNRKEFTALKRNIHRGSYQFVVFKEIARISRDGFIWKQFFKLCQEKKCEVVIRGLPIDPNDPASILQLDILAAFAEYEAKNTSKRIRESVFSAMINNKKFNSTHQVLGLDPIEINGDRKVGLYKPNFEELKNVTWIMSTFLKYGSHNKTLEACEEKGVTNKNGRPFLRHSLVTLLTNTKYIGKWYLNEENKLKPQDRLLPSEQYHEIDLPHGSVIDLDIWKQVQNKIAELSNSSGKHKNGENRVYPLSSGLLRYEDGSHFIGYCGNGKTQSSFYYRNRANQFNIKAPVIEQDAINTITSIVKNGKEYQDAIKRFGADVADHTQFLEAQLAKLETQLSQVQSEKKDYLENMRTLLKNCEGSDEIALIKEGFKDHLEQVSTKQKDLELQIIKVKRDLTQSKSTSFSWSKIGEHAERVLGVIAEKDPQALKSAYHALFDGVVVGPEDQTGVRSVSYILNHEDWIPHGPRSEMVVQKLGETTKSPSIYLQVKTVVSTTPLFENGDYLNQKYTIEGLSARQIAVLIGCSHSTINRALDTFKILRRRQVSGHIPYGYKLAKGHRIRHAREQKIIQQVVRKNGLGWSHAKIAAWLNSKKILSPSGKAKWYGSTVGCLLRAARKAR